MVSYEVQVFRGGSKWSTESQWDQVGRAMDHARTVLSALRYQGVRVVESRIDEASGVFREKTLMCRYRHQTGARNRSWRSRFAPARAFVNVRQEVPALTNAAMLCCGVLVFAIIGFFVAGGKLSAFQPLTDSGRITYDLPSITATLQGGATPRAVRLNLSLELREESDIQGVRRSLSRIVNAVIDGLETVSADRLEEKALLEELRAHLHSRIQAAAEDAHIEDVAVRRIQPF
jgi:flagellar basal body-associated protein FliL